MAWDLDCVFAGPVLNAQQRCLLASSVVALLQACRPRQFQEAAALPHTATSSQAVQGDQVKGHSLQVCLLCKAYILARCLLHVCLLTSLRVLN